MNDQGDGGNNKQQVNQSTRNVNGKKAESSITS